VRDRRKSRPCSKKTGNPRSHLRRIRRNRLGLRTAPGTWTRKPESLNPALDWRASDQSMSFMRPLTIIMLSLLRSQCASGFAARRASRFRADAYVSDEPVRHLHVTKRFSWRLLHKPASATALGRVWALCRWVGQRHKADNAPSISPLRMAALLCIATRRSRWKSSTGCSGSATEVRVAALQGDLASAQDFSLCPGPFHPASQIVQSLASRLVVIESRSLASRGSASLGSGVP